jgi:hypothetical protein
MTLSTFHVQLRGVFPVSNQNVCKQFFYYWGRQMQASYVGDIDDIADAHDAGAGTFWCSKNYSCCH